jgi:hypothetical protein
MLENMNHLKKKIKKLKHRIFDEEEEANETPKQEPPPEMIEAPIEEPAEEAPIEQPKLIRVRPKRKADLLNYTKFGF